MHYIPLIVLVHFVIKYELTKIEELRDKNKSL